MYCRKYTEAERAVTCLRQCQSCKAAVKEQNEKTNKLIKNLKENKKMTDKEIISAILTVGDVGFSEATEILRVLKEKGIFKKNPVVIQTELATKQKQLLSKDDKAHERSRRAFWQAAYCAAFKISSAKIPAHEIADEALEFFDKRFTNL